MSDRPETDRLQEITASLVGSSFSRPTREDGFWLIARVDDQKITIGYLERNLKSAAGRVEELERELAAREDDGTPASWGVFHD